jgi:hypothetical protein
MFFQILHHLPPVPQHLIDQVDRDYMPPDDKIEYLVQRNLSNWYGYAGLAAQNRAVDATAEFKDWVQKNITDQFSRCRVNYVDCSNNRKYTGAHTDGLRLYTLLWNIQTGGPDAKLCFYQESGQPPERELGLQKEDNTNLKVINSTIGPVNCWYLINSAVLHGVEELTSTRINFQISFTSTPNIV